MTQLQHQAWMLAPETQKVISALMENGGAARFVGGCVRNALANRPVLDIDIATPLPPEEVISRLTAHKIGYAPTGLKHGTVTAIADGHPFEITTLRHDVATDGRHAEVAFTDDWQADAARRDFTFNAMYATTEGELFDPFGGVEDLRAGRVRFVGDAAARIGEDVLRILRFFRFYAHFGKGAADVEALAACRAAAQQIPKLSAERLRAETLKLLDSENCIAAWRLMADCGVTEQYLPEAADIGALEKLVSLGGRLEAPPDALLRLAALLTGGADQVAQRLRLSNAQATRLAGLSARGNLPADDVGVRKLVYRQGRDLARDLLLLAAAKNEADTSALYKTASSFDPPEFPLTGTDALTAGLKPGPDVGRILHAIEDWWLAEDFRPGRTACLEQLRLEASRLHG